LRPLSTNGNQQLQAVKFEVVGSNLKAYLDGTLRGSATDSSLTAGKIALGALHLKTFFDDVRVTKP
jgi:pectate lyase